MGTGRAAGSPRTGAAPPPLAPAPPPTPPPSRASLARRLDRALARSLVRLAARLYLRKPDAADLVAIKIQGLRSVWEAFLNEVCYLLALPVSYRLMGVNLEILNACNLRCTMCPVNTTMRRPASRMPLDRFRAILDRNPGIRFLLPFQWGEPMLHEDFYRMVAYARSRGIRVMATTNGTRLEDEGEAERLATCGLERVTFSSDGVGETHTRIRGYPWERLRRNVARFREVRDRLASPTRIDVSMVLWDETRGDLEAYRAAWRGIADRIQVIPLLEPGRRVRRCRELYRGTITVLSDGSVVPCCADPEGALRIGNAAETPLRRIWNGPAMRDLRRRHRGGEFPEPCASCDEYKHDRVSKRFQ